MLLQVTTTLFLNVLCDGGWGGTKRPRSSRELWLCAVSYPLSLPTSPSAPRFGFAFAHPAAASLRGAGRGERGAVAFLEEIKKKTKPAKVTLRLRMLRGWESGTRGWAAGAGAERPREVAVLSRRLPRSLFLYFLLRAPPSGPLV